MVRREVRGGGAPVRRGEEGDGEGWRGRDEERMKVRKELTEMMEGI